MIKNLTTAVFVCFAQIIFAQISFVEASERLANKNVNSGAAIGVVDMNGDGLDDIIRLHSTTQLVIDEQTASGDFTSNVTGIVSPQSVWSICIGDVDRNGYNDIFLATANDFHRMAWADDTGSSFIEENLSGPPILPQASNMADINNDGHLDLFVCNDNGINLPYVGDGKTLNYDPSLINTETTQMSDNSGNYASMWIDYDNDHDQDLYIAKCRLGITDPMDPRRINQLFENDGNGNFTEVAMQRGLVPFAQSWAIDFGDIDNDGDLDAFLVNHDKASILYENDGNGNFTDITNGAGFSPAIDNHGLGIQVKMADFDNDTFLDILITSSQGGFRMFRNNGNKTFTPIFSAFQTLDAMQSFALGDLNNDGYLDVVGGFGEFFNTPTDVFDKLFLNSSEGNNWLRANLVGTNSNVNGIGARIELHGAWGVMLREIRSGESYGITNSLSANFGIGGATSIDRMVIRWPSGFVQTINNPDINQVHTIIEGGCIAPDDTFLDFEICEGEVLQFEDQTYDETGSYLFNYPLPDGCDSTIVIDLQVLPTYNILVPFTACEGQTITFPDGSSTVATMDAAYEVALLTNAGCDSLITIDIQVVPTYNTAESFMVCQGENYTWPDGTSDIILDSQSYTSQLLSQFNCDSTVVTSLTVIPAPNSQEFIQVCRGEDYTFPDGNTLTINDNTVYDLSFPTGGTCDSIVNYIVDLYPDYNIVESDIACLGGDYTFPDSTTFSGLTQGFSYTSFLETTNGCDSIILINLSLEEGTEESIFTSVCIGDNIIFPDGTEQVITQGMSQTSTLQNQFGCDSIIHTSIATRQSYQFTLTQMICSGDNFTFFDGTTEIDITEDLSHDSFFTTFDGCDSIITTELTVVPPIFDFADGLVCQGETFIFPDGTAITNIESEITQESVFTGSNGCDSIVVTTVAVSPSYNDVANFIVCSGETITINDIIIDGIENDTSIVFNETTTLGCDSIFTFNITVDNINNEISLSEATATASAVDVSYQWFDCNDISTPIDGATNQAFTPEVDGDYQVQLMGPTGCIAVSDCISIIGTDTEDESISSQINIYPNPASSEIQLTIRDIPLVNDVIIYDIHGKEILSLEIKNGTGEYDISALSSGLYFIRDPLIRLLRVPQRGPEHFT